MTVPVVEQAYQAVSLVANGHDAVLLTVPGNRAERTRRVVTQNMVRHAAAVAEVRVKVKFGWVTSAGDTVFLVCAPDAVAA